MVLLDFILGASAATLGTAIWQIWVWSRKRPPAEPVPTGPPPVPTRCSMYTTDGRCCQLEAGHTGPAHSFTLTLPAPCGWGRVLSPELSLLCALPAMHPGDHVGFLPTGERADWPQSPVHNLGVTEPPEAPRD